MVVDPEDALLWEGLKTKKATPPSNSKLPATKPMRVTIRRVDFLRKIREKRPCLASFVLSAASRLPLIEREDELLIQFSCPDNRANVACFSD